MPEVGRSIRYSAYGFTIQTKHKTNPQAVIRRRLQNAKAEMDPKFYQYN